MTPSLHLSNRKLVIMMSVKDAQDILDLMQNDNLYKTADFKVEDYEVEHPYAESFMSASDDTISFKSQENNSDGVINFPMRY